MWSQQQRLRVPELDVETSAERDGQLFTRNTKLKGRHTHEEMTHWTSVHSEKARASTARAKAEGSKDSKDSKTRTRTGTRTRNEPIECWNCGKRGHYSKDCWCKKENTTDAHNLDSTKPANCTVRHE